MENSLIYSLLLLVLNILLWRASFPKKSLIKLSLRLTAYILFSWQLIDYGINLFIPPQLSDSYFYYFITVFLATFWWFNGANLLSLLFNISFRINKNIRNRFLDDLVNAILYFGAIVASLAFVFNFPIRGLVATSGILAIVLGLAIQSSLSDVFSGMVLNATAPCKIGDWIKIDTAEGKVIDINWRATHLITTKGNIVIIPNSIIAKSRITNNSRPAKVHGVSILIEISIAERPAIVFSALNNALIGAAIILEDPKPFAMIKTTSINSFQYEITAFVDDIVKKRATSSILYDLCHRHLAAAGVELRGLGMVLNLPAEKFNRHKKLFSYVKLFSIFKDESIDFLISNMTQHFYQQGDIILKPGDIIDHLLVVASGVVSTERMLESKYVEIERFSPGDSLGEENIINNSPTDIFAKALIPTVIYCLDKNIINSLVKKHEISENMICKVLSEKTSIINSIGK